MSSAPKEYLHGLYFARVRERFEVCGTCDENDDKTKLILKCLGCNGQLEYPWLIKSKGDEWTGDFGKRLKHNLLTNRAHRKCKRQQSASGSVVTALKVENERLRNQITSGPTINNIVIVNLPAVTRIGSTGEPIMCSDIPYPKERTVRALLNNPEKAVSEFVYKQYFATKNPSISAPDPTNTKLKLVQRDKHGNHWVDAPLETTVDSIVYKTLDTLDDEFNAMECNADFKNWKRREGLTAHIGFDRTEAYQKLQSDVKDVLTSHGVPYMT